MSIHITDSEMTSDRTRHMATAWRVPDEPTLWTVSWLPGRNLTRNQAITAMVLAETVSAGIGDHTDPIWLHIEAWAGELGLSGAAAVGKISDAGTGHPVTATAMCRRCGHPQHPQTPIECPWCPEGYCEQRKDGAR